MTVKLPKSAKLTQISGPKKLSMDGALERLASNFQDLSPQLQRAAKFILDHPNEVGVSSMRRVATSAKVKPNTLVRLAIAVGFDSYEDLRDPFREALRRGIDTYPDRARWLQHLAHGHAHGQLFSHLAATCISNIETLFSTVSVEDVRTAADMIIKARTAYILGMGNCYSVMHGVYYVARMALDNLIFVPHQSSLPMDDLDTIGKTDLLFAATYQPYRRETVQATKMAKTAGAKIICLTDSRTSPIASFADVLFIAPTQTPQFFPSTIAMHALLESLLAFIVAEANTSAVRKIERINRRRDDEGVYASIGNKSDNA